MSKIVAYTALHYGAPFLASAIRSVIDYVDEYFVFYTDVGSHGFRSDAVCPDQRDDLMRIAMGAAGDKLRWYEGQYTQETEQRGRIHHYAPDVDAILIIDSDEVFLPAQVERLLDMALKGSVRNYLSYEMPFWRSFYRAIPDRLCQPVRAINPKNAEGTQSTDTFFAHFGYAQPTRYIEYKMKLHGHRADWRPEWFAERWLPNAQADLHPTNRDFWNTREVNPFDYVPAWMAEHPFVAMEVIE